MRKLLIISTILFSVGMAIADNHFVYLRFDESTNDVSALKKQLSQIAAVTSDTFLLYFDHKMYNHSEFSELMNSKSFLSNLSIYEPIQEYQDLNTFLDKYILESLNSYGDIKSENDNTWKMTFILHELSSKDDLIRWLDVNNFQNREVDMRFITFDEDTYLYYYNLQEFMAQATFMLNF